MSYKIIDNTASVSSDLTQKANLFLRAAAEEIHSVSTPNTPKKEGNLRREVLKQVLGLRGKIVWAIDYAARLELIQFKNYTTPGTGPHFAENAVKSAINKTQEIARRVGLI